MFAHAYRSFKHSYLAVVDFAIYVILPGGDCQH